MPRFDRPGKPEWKQQEDFDKAYTYLHYIVDALEECGDYENAAKIKEMEFSYRMRGATLRHQYAPMN